MRKPRLLILLLSLLFPCSFLNAQNISGVVNTYHKVTVVNGPNAYVVVDDPGVLGAGVRVMLVQMKGASVVTNNTNSFGDVLALNNAGNYELNTVCRVSRDTVYLLYTLVQSYTPSGKVQLVYVPVYENAVVVDSLKAKPWENATGKGGVLALEVTYSLTLQAPLSADGAGFSGGVPVLSNGVCWNSFLAASDPYYNAAETSPQNGAYKGESVWEPTNALYTGGKAATANGGGGGNNHNNGGGGGANLKAGGYGGGNNSSAGCTVSNPGEGGNALSNNGGLKIFLGGGGGAGQVDNGGILEGGGHGGGIVYLQAQSLASAGRTITANGWKGGDAIGDGASGGGAGGTIVMNVAAYTDAVSLEARGGTGGQENDEYNDQHCYGEGGGGSGGALYFKSAVPAGAVSTAGGARGAKINSDNVAPLCNNPVPGSAGTAGVTTTGYTPVQSATLSPSCMFVLPTQLLSFKASLSGTDVTTRWQVAQPGDVQHYVVERKREDEGWKEVARVEGRAGSDSYSATDRHLPGGRYLYRLKIVEKEGAVLYSPQQRINVAAAFPLTVYPNPAKGVLQIVRPAEADNELKVYDLSGRLLLQKEVPQQNGPLVALDISSLSKGLYVLRLGVLYKVFTIQ